MVQAGANLYSFVRTGIGEHRYKECFTGSIEWNRYSALEICSISSVNYFGSLDCSMSSSSFYFPVCNMADYIRV